MKQLIYIIALIASPLAFAVQVPVPVAKNSVIRLTAAPTVQSNFQALQRLGGSVGFTHKIGMGFEWGVSANGLLESERLFVEPNQQWRAGGLAMIRFLRDLTPIWYSGLQLSLSYLHNFDPTEINRVGEFIVGVSVPLTFKISEVWWVSAVPFATVGGQREADRNVDRFWGSRFGLGVDVWGMADFGLVSVFALVRPQMLDWGYPTQTFTTDFLAGVGFDL